MLIYTEISNEIDKKILLESIYLKQDYSDIAGIGFEPMTSGL